MVITNGLKKDSQLLIGQPIYWGLQISMKRTIPILELSWPHVWFRLLHLFSDWNASIMVAKCSSDLLVVAVVGSVIFLDWISFISQSIIMKQWYHMKVRLLMVPFIEWLFISLPPNTHRRAVWKDGAEIPEGGHCQSVLRPQVFFYYPLFLLIQWRRQCHLTWSSTHDVVSQEINPWKSFNLLMGSKLWSLVVRGDPPFSTKCNMLNC